MTKEAPSTNIQAPEKLQTSMMGHAKEKTGAEATALQTLREI
jgi:hypothetical protein